MARDPVVFVFPLPVNLANSRMHWRVKHKAKHEYWDACDALQCTKLIPAPPRTPWTRITVASDMLLGARMDDDNAMARHKWVLDWLVTRGYLADDCRHNIQWAGLPSQTITRGKNAVRGINLYITPEA